MSSSQRRRRTRRSSVVGPRENEFQLLAKRIDKVEDCLLKRSFYIMPPDAISSDGVMELCDIFDSVGWSFIHLKQLIDDRSLLSDSTIFNILILVSSQNPLHKLEPEETDVLCKFKDEYAKRKQLRRSYATLQSA